jgi:hypothetical protein
VEIIEQTATKLVLSKGKGKTWSSLPRGIFWAGVGWLLLYFNGATRLECHRVEALQVNCKLQKISWSLVHTLRDESIEQLQEAKIEVTSHQVGQSPRKRIPAYRVVLISPSEATLLNYYAYHKRLGQYRLSLGSSSVEGVLRSASELAARSGAKDHIAIAGRINQFIRDAERDVLVIYQVIWLEWLVLILGGFLLSYHLYQSFVRLLVPTASKFSQLYTFDRFRGQLQVRYHSLLRTAVIESPFSAISRIQITLAGFQYTSLSLTLHSGQTLNLERLADAKWLKVQQVADQISLLTGHPWGLAIGFHSGIRLERTAGKLLLQNRQNQREYPLQTITDVEVTLVECQRKRMKKGDSYYRFKYHLNLVLRSGERIPLFWAGGTEFSTPEHSPSKQALEERAVGFRQFLQRERG